MKLLIFSLCFLFSNLSRSEELSVLCTDFVGKSKDVTGCGIVGLNFDEVLNLISKKYGSGFSQLRLIGWDAKSNYAFLAVSKKTLIEKICYSDLDSIFKLNLKTKTIELLWDTQSQIGDVLDHIGSMTVLKHSMVRNSSEMHNCDPLLFINKIDQIRANLGSQFNPLLRENNFILIPGAGHPTVYFFSSDLRKLVGSFFITEQQNLLIDAVVSEKGTLLALLRDMPKQLLCVGEFDVESGSLIRKKCAPKNLELTYFTKGKTPFIFTREFKKGEKVISVKNWFEGENKFYDFRPKAYFPQYFFPHIQIEKE